MNLVDAIREDYTIVGHGRYLRTEEHDSLVIDTKTQTFFWNSKNLAGNLLDWFTKIKGLDYKSAKEIVGDNLLIVTPTIGRSFRELDEKDVVAFAPLVDAFHNHYLKVASLDDYWHDVRGYSDKTIRDFKLGLNNNWYTIPIYVDGKFKNFQCRRANPKTIRPWYKGMGPIPFNFSILNLTDWVVLTEGPVDAIMLRQEGIPAASQTGAAGYWNSEWLNYFTNMDRIYVVYDNDKAGREGSVRVAQNLGLHRTKIYNMWDFDEKFDVTDFFKNGKTASEFIELINTKSKFAFQLGA